LLQKAEQSDSAPLLISVIKEMFQMSAPKSKSTTFWIHNVIMFVLTIVFYFIPPFGGDITPYGMKIIGVFLGVLYGWTFLGFMWPSLFGMAALALAGYPGSFTAVFQAGFSNQIFIQLFVLFMLVAYLEKAGFVDYVAGWFMTRKFAIGRPYVLLTLILCGTGLLTMLGLGFAAMFIMWAIMYSIFDVLEYKKGDMLVTFMIYGSALCVGLAGSVLPFLPLPVMFNTWIIAAGGTFQAGPWIIWSFLFFVVFAVMYILVGKYVLRLNVQPFIDKKDLIAEVYQQRPMTLNQKIAMVSMIIFLIIALVPSFLPVSDFQAMLVSFGAVGALLVVVMITSLIRIDGKPITDWTDNIRTGMNWDLMIMFALTTPLGNALEGADAGILSTIISNLMPVLSSMSEAMFIVLVLAFFLIFTQVAHNVVLIIALSPTLLSLAIAMGINPTLLAAGICVIAQAAFMTPGASSPSAAVFGNTQWVDTKHAYIVGTIIVVLAAISAAIVYPLGAMFMF